MTPQVSSLLRDNNDSLLSLAYKLQVHVLGDTYYRNTV